MPSIGTLVPAYGRDYKSKEALVADWNEGKDFRIAGGPYIDAGSAARYGIQSVTIRYSQLRKVAVLHYVQSEGTWV